MDNGNTQDAQVVLTPKQNLENMEHVRDLFARAHDYIAQAEHPGHLAPKIAEVMNFLAFHYQDFKLRAENEAKKIASTVDVKAAEAAVEAALAPETATEAPKS